MLEYFIRIYFLEYIFNNTDFNTDYDLYNWVHQLVNKLIDTNDVRWKIEDNSRIINLISTHCKNSYSNKT
jgi:hypothetical protein